MHINKKQNKNSENKNCTTQKCMHFDYYYKHATNEACICNYNFSLTGHTMTTPPPPPPKYTLKCMCPVYMFKAAHKIKLHFSKCNFIFVFFPQACHTHNLKKIYLHGWCFGAREFYQGGQKHVFF